jgi:hypothetical protein
MSALGACPSSTLYLEEHINENKSVIYHYMVEHFKQKQKQKSTFLLSLSICLHYDGDFDYGILLLLQPYDIIDGVYALPVLLFLHLVENVYL